MAESYVPEDTTVVCTQMTNGTPQEIKITSPRNVTYKKGEKPLLTVIDTKLSGPFECKTPGKFWGGLQALALGIAVGAAIVLTGGAAAVVVVAACAISVGAGVTGLYKMAHDCDATLDLQWEEWHPRVRFNKQFAILNRSYIDCTKGKGKITIIMDPVIAQQAAEYISSNNNKEGITHMGAQFAMGFITAYTATAELATVAISGVITLGMYTPGEWLGENINSTAASDTTSALAGDAITAGVGKATGGMVSGAIFNQEVANLAKGAAQYGAAQLTDDVGKGLEGALRYALSSKALKGSGYKSIGGFFANLTIGIASDTYENYLAKDTKDKAKDFNDSDAANGISITAQKA